MDPQIVMTLREKIVIVLVYEKPLVWASPKAKIFMNAHWIPYPWLKSIQPFARSQKCKYTKKLAIAILFENNHSQQSL